MRRRSRFLSLPLMATVTILMAGAAGLTLMRSMRSPLMAGLAPESLREAEEKPSDWFGWQRAYPFEGINQEAWLAAAEHALVERAESGLPSVNANLTWVQAGPFNIGGRVTALAGTPGGSTIYLGAANGGVFKSINSGTNWIPIFDQIGVYSIGALALDPNDSNTIYCGTGEANAAVDTYDGAGVFASTNGGASWASLGLAETRRIGRIAVDPSNSNRIFVAAMGTQFSTGPHRGLYRSEDGGGTWTKVLFVNDSTGVCDVVINPARPDTVYCASWERVRHYTYRRAFGPGCGIWRSTDAGDTWTRLQNGLPAPSDNVGRIGLAIAPSSPSWVYAQIITGSSGGYTGLGMYRTTNSGDSWVKRDVSGFTTLFGGFGWYFGEMGVDPTNPNRVYALGQSMASSNDGGQNFNSGFGSDIHVDHHAIWIDPLNANRIRVGNDGGFYSSTSGGAPWTKSLDLPITQFYAGTIDPSNANRLLGGTQDNNTLITSGSPTAWTPILGGDGFQCLVDPNNPDVVFAEYQFCSGGQGLQRSTDGGGNFFVPSGFVSTDRYNWNSPIAMNPRNSNTLIVGSHRLYRSRDNGMSYSTISPDLTRNIAGSLLTFSTLSTVAISAADTNVYWTGSDDGRVQRSTNSGGSWTDVTGTLPIRWITRVTPDPNNAQIAYVTLSGFGEDESLAHVYRTTNSGGNWTSVSGNLPDVPANDILVDPINTDRLFLGTDIGVYVSHNLGGFWSPLGQGMPLQAVFDLTLHAPSRTLVAATHGRSQWKLDLNDLPVAVEPALAVARLSLSNPAPNPSRGDVAFHVELTSTDRVEVAVFDATGRRIRVLHEGTLAAGRHTMRWSGADMRGSAVPAGVYYLRGTLRNGATLVRRVVRIT